MNLKLNKLNSLGLLSSEKRQGKVGRKEVYKILSGMQKLIVMSFTAFAQARTGESHIKLWWVDAGWTPGAHQSCSITPLLSWAGGRKYNQRLMAQHEDRERSLTHDCHRQNSPSLGKLAYLLPIKSE